MLDKAHTATAEAVGVKPLVLGGACLTKIRDMSEIDLVLCLLDHIIGV